MQISWFPGLTTGKNDIHSFLEAYVKFGTVCPVKSNYCDNHITSNITHTQTDTGSLLAYYTG